MTIAIIDYGVGNLASVRKAFRAVGHEAVIVHDPERLAGATAVVLPGVGHFGHCAREFHKAGFGAVVNEAHSRGVPILGICVGMQLLYEASEEAEDEPGLGLLAGRVRRMRGVPKLPQVGWNEVRVRRTHPWLGGLEDRSYLYFVHSYAAEPADELVLGTVDYGGERAAIVADGAILGVQFHPEKSGSIGLAVIRSFAEAVG